ncbi:hypothetical protein HYPGJ_30619 [Hyphomicrobium sp. GJ21]|nr:hypothetical protein HYPGJ_30619 [Hyphomicrobium sp. GJ21]
MRRSRAPPSRELTKSGRNKVAGRNVWSLIDAAHDHFKQRGKQWHDRTLPKVVQTIWWSALLMRERGLRTPLDAQRRTSSRHATSFSRRARNSVPTFRRSARISPRRSTNPLPINR